jgi:hypothetical protein
MFFSWQADPFSLFRCSKIYFFCLHLRWKIWSEGPEVILWVAFTLMEASEFRWWSLRRHLGVSDNHLLVNIEGLLRTQVTRSVLTVSLGGQLRLGTAVELMLSLRSYQKVGTTMMFSCCLVAPHFGCSPHIWLSSPIHEVQFIFLLIMGDMGWFCQNIDHAKNLIGLVWHKKYPSLSRFNGSFLKTGLMGTACYCGMCCFRMKLRGDRGWFLQKPCMWMLLFSAFKFSSLCVGTSWTIVIVFLQRLGIFICITLLLQ